ncbi:hypothetical protein MKX72_19955 [Priestia sp. FSL R5-0597]|uniref:hypothetical protein n=1 Tax=Priestia sp. FSL R5-0597 TaxID=2921580 RepID=UPI0030FA885C
MASPKIENETVYVVYYEGKPYYGNGSRIVYTKESLAKSTITKDSYEKAKELYNKKREKEGYHLDDWEDISIELEQELIESVKNKFSIVEYAPKK